MAFMAVYAGMPGEWVLKEEIWTQGYANIKKSRGQEKTNGTIGSVLWEGRTTSNVWCVAAFKKREGF